MKRLEINKLNSIIGFDFQKRIISSLLRWDSVLSKSILILIITLLSQSSFGQSQISQSRTVAQWVQNVLVGQGMTVSNSIYTGSASSWGELIYSAKSPFEHWDGMYQGQNAPQGVYTYIIIVEELQMEPYTISGTVQLIR